MDAPGTRLGPYELLAPLGAGGMGEVFRARDSRLGREVAIKVLSGPFAFDAERRARFDREARVLASLNHPNIATLYGVEESAGTQALVLELVEGPTLADRIAAQRRLGGGLSVPEALVIAEQIAAALEAAHEHGIIHRDLKPANVALTRDENVKVLDFGLAKVFALESGEQESKGATVTATAGLAVVGTTAYMSPEQLRGLPVDKRADVWAFGCVLFEMLSGEVCFAGEHSSDVVAKVIEREPDIGLLPPQTPPAIRRLLRRCLEKDPRRRLRDIGDARLEIADAMAEITEGPIRVQPLQRTSRWKLAVTAVLGALGALLAGEFIARFANRPALPAVARFDVVVPRGHELVGSAYQSVAISPQGTHLAYAADARIYVRALDTSDARALAGTEDQTVGGMMFSPDGQWLAFQSRRLGELRRVPIQGGASLKIATVNAFLGGSWGADNRIVFAQLDGIYAVAASGGEPVRLIEVDQKRGERAQNPQLLPNGRVVFTLVNSAQDGAVRSSIAAQTPGVNDRRIVIERGTDARYFSGDRLVYADERTLAVVPFDPDNLRVKGPALPVIRQLARQPVRNGADFAVSASGALVYREGNAPISTLAWIDRSGHQEAVGVPPRKYSYVRLSPDGTRIAMNIDDADQEIYIWDIARRNFARFTFNPGPDYQPIWTPDAKRVAYASIIGGRAGVSWQRADGTGGERLFSAPAGDVWNPNSFTPEGAQLVVREITLSLDTNLWLLSLDKKSARPLIATVAREFNGEISPDGRWLAYQSDESGTYEVYVRPFPNVDKGHWQVSMGGGSHPMWNPDGRELFYLASGHLLGVKIESGATPSMGSARIVVASVPFPPYAVQGRTFDISPDGRRFLFKVRAADAEYDPLEGLVRYEVVLNWTEELRRLAAE